jgi:hypothetical protein
MDILAVLGTTECDGSSLEVDVLLKVQKLGV